MRVISVLPRSFSHTHSLPGCTRFITAGDPVIRVWTITPPKCIGSTHIYTHQHTRLTHTFTYTPTGILEGHTKALRSVQWSNDATRIASGKRDKERRICVTNILIQVVTILLSACGHTTRSPAAGNLLYSTWVPVCALFFSLSLLSLPSLSLRLCLYLFLARFDRFLSPSLAHGSHTNFVVVKRPSSGLTPSPSFTSAFSHLPSHSLTYLLSLSQAWQPHKCCGHQTTVEWSPPHHHWTRSTRI